jgi:hypothetical protein
VRYLGHVSYEWPEGWAKTDKQRQRCEQFRGDKMHFFAGVIEGFTKVQDEEDAWQGEKLMLIGKVIAFIEQMKPFPEELAL